MLIGCCGDTRTYRIIRQMGYDYAELSGRQIMGLSEEEFQSFVSQDFDKAFPCVGFNDFCDKNLPLIGPACALPAQERYVQELCRRGARLGIFTIGIGAPSARRLPDGYPRKRAKQEMTDFLRMACETADKSGITILLEAVHQYMCNYMNLTKEVWEIVREQDLPNLAIVLDYYHAAVMRENLHDLAYVMPCVRHLHFSTDLENHERGFPEEKDVSFLHQLLRETAAAGCRSQTISIEANPLKLIADGESGLRWMRLAAEGV